MGVLNNIKNFVTGGAAEISLDFSPAKVKREDEVKVLVTVKALDNIHIKDVVVNIKAVEETTSKDILFSQSEDVDKNIQLNKDDTKTWETTVKIPSDAIKSWRGKHSRLDWFINAEIELPGLNPDSDWQKFYVV